MSFSILPALSGVVNSTRFTFTDTRSYDTYPLSTRIWDLGDGNTVYNDAVVSHTYTYPGTYTVSLCSYDVYNNAEITRFDIFADYFLRDSVIFTHIPSKFSLPGKFTDDTFTVSITSAQVRPMMQLDLYAANSPSQPLQYADPKWAELTPTWRFYDDTQKNVITSLALSSTIIYDISGNAVATSATGSFYFVDDMSTGDPTKNCPLLIAATLATSAFNLPTDSVYYPYESYSNSQIARAVITWQVQDSVPDSLRITGNYLSPINGVNWVGKPIPFMVSAHTVLSALSSTSGILFSYPSSNELGAATAVTVNTTNPLITGVDIEGAPLYFQRTDSNGYRAGGYILSTATFSESAAGIQLSASGIVYTTINANDVFPYPTGFTPFTCVCVSNASNNTLNFITNTPTPSGCTTIDYYRNLGLLIDTIFITEPVSTTPNLSTFNYSMSGISGIYGIAANPKDQVLYCADSELDVIYKYSIDGNLLISKSLSSFDSDINLYTGLLAHWKLDETSGTRYDSTSNHYDMADSGGVGYSQGKIGNAASLHNNYLTNPALTEGVVGSTFSMSWWGKTDLVTESRWATKYAGFIITTRPTGGFVVSDYTSWAAESDPVVNANEWTHYCIVVVNGIVTGYVNGAQVITSGSDTVSFGGARDLNLGGDTLMSYGNPEEIDSASIWNRALSLNEISALYNNGDGLGYESFEGYSSSTPAAIAIDKEGDVWVTLWNSVSAIKFDSDLNYLFSVQPSAISIIEEEYGDRPTFVETDRVNNAWVTYSHPLCSLLMKYSQSGSLLLSIPLPENSIPVNMVINNVNDIWVTNTFDTTLSAGLINMYNSTTGVLLSSITGFYRPGYIALNRKGQLWFTHGVRGLGFFDPYTHALSSWSCIRGGLNFIPTTIPQISSDIQLMEDEDWGGMTIDVYDRIWLLDSVENAAYAMPSDPNLVASASWQKKFTMRPDVGVAYFLSTDDTYTYTLSGVEGTKSAQAFGDWTGNRWYQKYLNFSELSSFGVTGVSETFDVLPMTDPFEFRKINESFDMGDYLHRLAIPEILSKNTNLFDVLLPSMVGQASDPSENIGLKCYEGIANFALRHADVDMCDVSSLMSMAASTATKYSTFSDSYPQEINRLIDIFSISKSRLFGTRSETPVLSASIGDLILHPETLLVSKGDQFVVRSQSNSDIIRLYTVTIDVTSVPLSSLSVTDLMSPVTTQYIWYKYDPTATNAFINNYIDWNSEYTTVTPSSSAYPSWYAENGTIERAFNYLLTKNLIS